LIVDERAKWRRRLLQKQENEERKVKIAGDGRQQKSEEGKGGSTAET
jgi:hypothetical protein